MTVCGLSCVLTVTDEVLQVGFLKKVTVGDWMVVGGVQNGLWCKECIGAKVV